MTEPFRPKAGMRYVMECGEEVGPLEFNPGAKIFVLWDSRHSPCWMWTRDGKFNAHDAESPFDLIAEAKPAEGAACANPASTAMIKGSLSSNTTPCAGPTLSTSASTIARLEAENARLNAAILVTEKDLGGEIEKADATIASLRATVKELQAAQSQAVIDVVAERKRQVVVERFDADHDDIHHDTELPRAAAHYALAGTQYGEDSIWPWDWMWWKPKSQRENLIRAAALVVAAIEKLDRNARAALAKSKEWRCAT